MPIEADAKLTISWFWTTAIEWVTDVSFIARANGQVVVHFTCCVQTAGAGTRISALFIDASFLARAVRVDHTLRSTVWWGTDIVIQTRA